MADTKSEIQMAERTAETASDEILSANEGVVTGFTASSSTLPKGYYVSSYFLGTMFATGLGLYAGVAGYGLPAPVLGIINQDIGPSPDIIWVALAYSLVMSVGFTLFGSLSDIFGRRWCCVGGACFGLLGAIIGATAKGVNQLIVASAFIGLAGSTQLSQHITIGELVPMQYRFAANAVLFIFCIPASGLAPAISNTIILKTAVGWRGIYYILIAANGASLICWILFYHPPTFHMKHRNASKRLFIKNLDYGGIFLYTAGLLLLLLGLSWGGSIHPWKSAAVIAPIVIGILSLIALGFYEVYVPQDEPLIPVHLFKNGPWVASVTLLGLGAGVYYAFALVWPSMVAVEYSNGDPIYGGLVSSLHGCAIIAGQLVGGVLAKPMGHVKITCIVTYLCGGILLACVATTTPDTPTRAIGLLFGGCFLIGWTEMLGLGLSTVAINDQQEIGAAGGIGASIRSALGTIAAAIYSSVLTTRLTETIPAQVPPALIEAGLPASSVPAFLSALTTGSFVSVPGISDTIIVAGTTAYKWASSDAYQTVFIASLAFTGLGLITCIWVPNVEDRMTNDVAATLHERNTEKVVGEKGV